MRHISIITILLTLAVFFAYDAAHADAPAVPSAVGGFVLNSSIDEYKTKNHANYLNEVIITDLQGFRKGFITYGTCLNEGKILRIKLKYENGSQDFFNELLEQYKAKFGSSPGFSGDPFGNVKSWKWSFTDEQGRRVNLQLQHNLRDTDESIGNMVKLSMPELMNDERRCFNKIHDKDSNSSENQSSGKEILNWDLLLPK